MIVGIHSFLFDKNRTNITQNIDFIENNKNYFFKNIPNFDLLFFTSIIGNIFLKAIGFRLSTILFMFINIIIIFFFRSYEIPEDKYNFYKIALLILYYILLFISIGSISLSSHQIYFEGLLKYYEYEDIEKRKSYNIYLCLSFIPPYLISLIISFWLKKKDYFGINYFIIVIIIFFCSLFISIIIYIIYSCIFIKQEVKKDDFIRSVCRLFGYIIYSEKRVLINKENKICCSSCKLACKKFYNLSNESTLYFLFPCLCIPACCGCIKCLFKIVCCKSCDCPRNDKYYESCCCFDEDLTEFYQEKEEFWYCYKVQIKCSWFCDILFKNDILTLIIMDIFLELITIGFQKITEINLEKNDINTNMISLVIYLVSFLSIVILNKTFCFWCKFKDDISQETINLTRAVIYNLIIVIIFSGFSSFGKPGLRNFTDNYLSLIPIAITKFYYFILMNNLITIVDKNNIDLLSNSTVVSLFLSIYNISASFFVDILNINVKGLVLFQFIFGLIIFFPIICIYLFSLMKITSEKDS